MIRIILIKKKHFDHERTTETNQIYYPILNNQKTGQNI